MSTSMQTMNSDISLESIIEAMLFAAGKPMLPEQIRALFPENEAPEMPEIKKALEMLHERYQGRGIKLQQVASGYRFQVRQRMIPWVSRLWSEKAPRYTRALLETLALIAYRQPITRGEIEEVRGVAVSSQTVRTLQEREWIRVVGRREVPGRPAMYATTRQFLDHFNLTSLNDLPPLGEIRDINTMAESLDAASSLSEESAGLAANQEVREEGREKSVSPETKEKSKPAPGLVDHEKANAFREEREQADQEIFATVDQLLSSVKTDFTDSVSGERMVEE